MDIKLGLLSSENLLPELNRKFIPHEREIKDILSTLGGSRGQYYTDTKYDFEFSYDKITPTNFDIIKTEFDRHTTLSLLVEQSPDSGTYDSYTVIWGDKGLPRPWWKVMSVEGSKILIAENVSFMLLET